MNHTRKRAITLVHADTASSIATWWKAIMFVPFWLLPLLPVLGKIFSTCGMNDVGISGIIALSVYWFALDLLGKRVVIDDRKIRFRSNSLPANGITSISVENNRFKLPKYLILKGATRREIKLTISALSGSDMQRLVDVVHKLSPRCTVEPLIDELLRQKRERSHEILETASSALIDYHVDRVWSDLPRSFRLLLRSWTRTLGPLGCAVICWPFSIGFAMLLYEIVITNWGSYEEHKGMYDVLVKFVTWWSNIQADVVRTGVDVASNQIFANPIIFSCIIALLVYALIEIGRSLVSPNKITVDQNELSLDRWNYLFSQNTGRILWRQVSKVLMRRHGAKREIVFFGDSNSLRIDPSCIDGKDRGRLLQAIRKFAPECAIEPEVIEELEPVGDKSYTQLWLQSLTTAPENKTLEPIKPGALLDRNRYEVIRRLGVGGLGAAYLSYDLGQPDLERAPVVVLKETLVPMFVDNIVKEEAIERFVAEAKMLARVQSPNVVKLLDYFVDSRGTYLVLEHIEGTTLQQLISERGVLPPQEVEKLSVQMLQILKTLHAQEIVHRDFTPDNLILTPDGTLKLIDFNVAQEETQGTTATIVGKHAYVPPEQFRGRATAQSDLYAFGATIYYLLCGEDPEPITQSILPESLQAEAPGLNAIVRKCTALELTQRAQTAEQLLKEIDSETATNIPVSDCSRQSDGNIIEVAAVKVEVGRKLHE